MIWPFVKKIAVASAEVSYHKDGKKDGWVQLVFFERGSKRWVKQTPPAEYVSTHEIRRMVSDWKHHASLPPCAYNPQNAKRNSAEVIKLVANNTSGDAA